MTSNFTLMDGLGLDLKIFNLTHQKRSEAKVDLGGHFKICQYDFKLHTCGWFGMIFENIQSDPQKEVKGQS